MFMVSIHAPPRGARPRWNRGSDSHSGFQSTRPHEGRDARRRRPPQPRAKFQSTRPHEGRDQAPRRLGQRRRKFQSTRPHEGRDAPPMRWVLGTLLFQSTRPHEGRDGRDGAGDAVGGSFNPRAPTRGATLSATSAYEIEIVSIHAPPRGARHGNQRSSTPKRAFQSTRPHEGRDHAYPPKDDKRRRFNPRAPTRGATSGIYTSTSAPMFQSTRPHEGRDRR